MLIKNTAAPTILLISLRILTDDDSTVLPVNDYAYQLIYVQNLTNTNTVVSFVVYITVRPFLRLFRTIRLVTFPPNKYDGPKYFSVFRVGRFRYRRRRFQNASY